MKSEKTLLETLIYELTSREETFEKDTISEGLTTLLNFMIANKDKLIVRSLSRGGYRKTLRMKKATINKYKGLQRIIKSSLCSSEYIEEDDMGDIFHKPERETTFRGGVTFSIPGNDPYIVKMIEDNQAILNNLSELKDIAAIEIVKIEKDIERLQDNLGEIELLSIAEYIRESDNTLIWSICIEPRNHNIVRYSPPTSILKLAALAETNASLHVNSITGDEFKGTIEQVINTIK